MAKLDPRLLDLLDTLVAARLDWLVFELMDGIRSGRRMAEPPAVLAEVRRSVRSDGRPAEREASASLDQGSVPIQGDEQIEWAASYVADRLDTIIAELKEAMDNLDSIRGSSGRLPDALQDGAAGAPLVIVLDDEEPRKAERDGLNIARNALPQLRTRVMAWSAEVRGQIQI